MFATVMTSTGMSSRKVSALVVEVEREPKSRRIIFVTTNTSPALGACILSTLSHSLILYQLIYDEYTWQLCPIEFNPHTNNHIRCYQHVTVLLTGCRSNFIFMPFVVHHDSRTSNCAIGDQELITIGTHHR